jgi:predicted MFS family arabinose efflux permease
VVQLLSRSRPTDRHPQSQEQPIKAEQYSGIWRATLSGFCATLVGNGLGRFAFTPLIPALIGASWFTPPQAYYLQAANLAGYLAGALLGRAMAVPMNKIGAMRFMMLVATASLFACAVPISFWWFAIWRFASGLAGGVLITLAATQVLPHVPRQKAGLAAGIIFAGVAVGIAGSGTVVPLLLRLGLTKTLVALGALSLVLTVTAWNGWPGSDQAPLSERRAIPQIPPVPRANSTLASLYIEYSLVAMALVPHMIFIVDFVARGLGQGIDIGSFYWVIFGISAIVGSLLAGWLGDRIGFRVALRLALAIEAVAVLMPAVLQMTLPLILSTVLVGAFVPGSSTLVLGCIQQHVRDDASSRAAAWRIATVSFALGQAMAAYAFSWLFAVTGSYTLLFVCGAGVLALSLGIDVIWNPRPRYSK